MTITIEELEYKRKVQQAEAAVAQSSEYCRTAFRTLERNMQDLHALKPSEHLCCFILSAPEIPPKP